MLLTGTRGSGHLSPMSGINTDIGQKNAILNDF